MENPLDIVRMANNHELSFAIMATMMDELARQIAEDYLCYVDGDEKRCESVAKCKRCILTNVYFIAKKKEHE